MMRDGPDFESESDRMNGDTVDAPILVSIASPMFVQVYVALIGFGLIAGAFALALALPLPRPFPGFIAAFLLATGLGFGYVVYVLCTESGRTPAITLTTRELIVRGMGVEAARLPRPEIAGYEARRIRGRSCLVVWVVDPHATRERLAEPFRDAMGRHADLVETEIGRRPGLVLTRFVFRGSAAAAAERLSAAPRG